MVRHIDHWLYRHAGSGLKHFRLVDDGEILFRRHRSRRRSHQWWWRSSQALFELLDDGQKIASLERLHDHAIGANPIRILRAGRWFHFADGQQDRSFQSRHGTTNFFANFQAGISGHVQIEDDDVGLLFGDLLYRSSAVTDGDDFVAGLSKNSFTHVLGSYAVI